MAVWINVKDIADSAKFHSGAAIRIMPVPRGLEEGNFIPKGGLVYLISEKRFEQELF